MSLVGEFKQQREVRPIPAGQQKRCACGCKKKAAYAGVSRGLLMMTGCAQSVQAWSTKPTNQSKGPTPPDH